MSSSSTKTSALAIVPHESAWPLIQEFRKVHDSTQFPVWSPHMNFLYPFVPEAQYEEVAERLAEATRSLGPLKIRFSRFGSFGKVAYLEPECEADPGLRRLYEACAAALPELPRSRRPFAPHLTVGQFQTASECSAFLQSAPPVEIEVEVSCISLLARDTMRHAFRTPLRVHLGRGIERGSAEPYSPGAATASSAPLPMPPPTPQASAGVAQSLVEPEPSPSAAEEGGDAPSADVKRSASDLKAAEEVDAHWLELKSAGAPKGGRSRGGRGHRQARVWQRVGA